MAVHAELIAVEDVRGANHPVTIVRFIKKKMINGSEIEAIGKLLYDLVDEHQRGNLLLHFGGVESISSALIGKLVGLNGRIQRVGGRLALCIHPKREAVVDQCIEVCGLKRVFHIYAEEQEALQSF